MRTTTQPSDCLDRALLLLGAGGPALATTLVAGTATAAANAMHPQQFREPVSFERHDIRGAPPSGPVELVMCRAFT